MSSKKLSTYYVYKVLVEYSDSEHYLTQQQIVKYLRRKYDLTLDRKTVASCIKQLIDVGYDITENSEGRGVALFSRLFDETQIRYLFDSIYSSHSINQKQAQDLIKALTSTLSTYDRRQYATIYKSYDTIRTDNSNLFYTISIIQEAIKNHKKISFKYLHYNLDGKLVPRKSRKNPSEDNIYHISPYYLANCSGKYYVLCSQYNFDKMVTYRVDFISDVEVEGEDATDKKTLETFKNFDITKYMKNHIYMINNQVVNINLKIKKEQEEKGINVIYDWFGKNANCYKKDEQVYADVKAGIMDIVFFALQYADSFIIEGPEEAREQVEKLAEIIADNYLK